MEVNDYEIMYMIYQNDETALRMLMDKYHESVRFIIYRYKGYRSVSWNYDDLIQLAFIKLIDAVYTYREDREASFSSYFLEIFRRAVIDQFRRNKAQRYSYEIANLSMDMEVSDNNAQFQGVYVVDDHIETLYVNERIQDIKQGLSDVEQAVIDLRMRGYTYQQIAKQLNITKKKVEYTLRKIRNTKRKER